MTTEKNKHRGRPVGYRVKNPATERLPVRVTADQLTSYRTAAAKADASLSEWVRDTLDQAVDSPAEK